MVIVMIMKKTPKSLTVTIIHDGYVSNQEIINRLSCTVNFLKVTEIKPGQRIIYGG